LVIHTAQAGRKRHTLGAGGTHRATPDGETPSLHRRDATATPCQKENSCQRPFYIGTRPSPKLKKLTDGVN